MIFIVQCVSSVESGCLGVQPKSGGKLHLRLNMTTVSQPDLAFVNLVYSTNFGIMKFFVLCVLALASVRGDELASDAKRRIDITFAYKDLPDMDPIRPKPDAFAIIYYSRSIKSNPYRQVGETSTNNDANQGSWPQIFSFEVHPELDQQIKIEVFDSDYNAHDFIGFAEVPLSEILAANELRLEKKLLPDRSGTLIIKGYYNDAVVTREPEATMLDQ